MRFALIGAADPIPLLGERLEMDGNEVLWIEASELADPLAVGLCDVIFLAPDLDLQVEAPFIRRIRGHDTAVLDLSNDPAREEALLALVGHQYLLHCEVRGEKNRLALVIHERDEADTWRLRVLQAACHSAGIDLD